MSLTDIPKTKIKALMNDVLLKVRELLESGS